MTLAGAALQNHMRSGASNKRNQKTMKEPLKLASAFAATLLLGIAFGAINPPEARAGEFCRRDVTGHMMSCGFDNMAQCQAASAGVGGDCLRDPFLDDTRSAYAYSPKKAHSKRGSPTAGSAASSSN